MKDIKKGGKISGSLIVDGNLTLTSDLEVEEKIDLMKTL